MLCVVMDGGASGSKQSGVCDEFDGEGDEMVQDVRWKGSSKNRQSKTVQTREKERGHQARYIYQVRVYAFDPSLRIRKCVARGFECEP